LFVCTNTADCFGAAAAAVETRAFVAATIVAAPSTIMKMRFLIRPPEDSDRVRRYAVLDSAVLTN